MATREQFLIPKRYNTTAMVLMAIGVISVIILFITHGSSGDDHERARFWGSLLQNSVYFLLVVNAAMFFLCATTLAWGGFTTSFRRVSEAVASAVPVIGVICGVILLAIVFGNDHSIYHWAAPDDHLDDILKQKSPFLNKTF